MKKIVLNTHQHPKYKRGWIWYSIAISFAIFCLWYLVNTSDLYGFTAFSVAIVLYAVFSLYKTNKHIQVQISKKNIRFNKKSISLKKFTSFYMFCGDAMRPCILAFYNNKASFALEIPKNCSEEIYHLFYKHFTEAAKPQLLDKLCYTLKF